VSPMNMKLAVGQFYSLRILFTCIIAMVLSCIYVVTPRVTDVELYRFGFPFQWLEFFRQTFPLAPPSGGPWKMVILPSGTMLDLVIYYTLSLILWNLVSRCRRNLI
jgi:hypothetical protein